MPSAPNSPTSKRIPFSKKPISFADQLQQLKSRGMLVPDETAALHYLSHLNYYRLSAYWLPFEQDHASHQFFPETSFEDVLNFYVFDRELRLLIIDAVERIEVSVRTQLAYHLSHQYGPHAFLQADIFYNVSKHRESLRKLTSEVNRTKENFILHFKEKYEEPMPPIWAVVELMSMGQLSTWYDNLKERKDRKSIADVYSMDEMVLRSYFHHLSTVRNLCAHHARVWNRDYVFKSKLPNKRSAILAAGVNRNQGAIKKIYNTLTMLAYLMDVVSPKHHWKIRLKELIKKHDITTSQMGFPEDWLEREIWDK